MVMKIYHRDIHAAEDEKGQNIDRRREKEGMGEQKNSTFRLLFVFQFFVLFRPRPHECRGGNFSLPMTPTPARIRFYISSPRCGYQERLPPTVGTGGGVILPGQISISVTRMPIGELFIIVFRRFVGVICCIYSPSIVILSTTMRDGADGYPPLLSGNFEFV